jgi:antitoxin component YwqK of YwqJK toxin-antitoxin module
MKRIFLSILIFLATMGVSFAQTLNKVVITKHENGKPELVDYYKGASVAINLAKQEKYSIDGKKIIEKNFMNGKLHGPVVEWKEFDGTKISELNYELGQLAGKQTYYFSDGKPKLELNYAAGKLDGRQVEYWFKKSADSLKTEHNFSGGILHGLQRQWTKEGKPIYNLNFVAGKPDGLQRFWSESGDMTEEKWKQGVYEDWLEKWTASQPKHTLVADYAPKGDSMNIAFNKVPQKEVWYFETGAIEALTTNNGNAIETQVFYLGGKVKGKGNGSFDQREGKWEFWYQNAKRMMAGEYRGGKQIGLFETWDENGKLISEEYWNPDGSKRESWKIYSYFPGGTKESEGTLNPQGYKKGKWKYWYANGNKMKEEEWDFACQGQAGRPFVTSLTLWDDSGRLIAKGTESDQEQYSYFPNGNPMETMKVTYPNRTSCAKGPTDVFAEGKFKNEIPAPANADKVQVLEKITFYEGGDTAKIDRYNLEGKPDENQEGWFNDGKKQYVYHYKNGSVQGSVKEWYPSGQIMLDHKYTTQNGNPSLVEGIYYTEKAKDYPYLASDGKKKKVMEEIDLICYFLKFAGENK